MEAPWVSWEPRWTTPVLANHGLHVPVTFFSKNCLTPGSCEEHVEGPSRPCDGPWGMIRSGLHTVRLHVPTRDGFALQEDT